MFSSNTSQVSDGGYQISRSLRFNSADSAYLNRTPASAGSRTTWTWSAWIKRSGLSTEQHLFEANSSEFYLVSSGGSVPDSIVVRDNATNYLITSQVFRDVSAWYHIVLTWDSSNATAGDRVRLYVNGSRVTAFGTSNNPTLNQTSSVNSTNAHFLGEYYGGGSYYYNGYMTEVNFIDGQALTPSSFGETNAQTGVWQPKAYSGSYGTNGFYLNFSDNSNTTAATLGKDYSGNGNNWTPNNFSVSAGAGNDSFVDSPTSYGTTDTGVGGEIRGNYCTLNPISGMMATASWQGVQNGNLTFVPGTTNWVTNNATFAVSSGKWYWEVSGTTANEQMHGIVKVPTVMLSGTGNYLSQYPDSYSYYNINGNKFTYSANSAYGATYTTNDVIGVALDMDAGTLTFYKNGTSQGVAFTGLSGTFAPAFAGNGTGGGITVNVNFGQRPFAYTAPSGYKALCTQNLPTPTIGATSTTLANKYFDVTTYTGNGSSQSITNSGSMQPDLVWGKNRASAVNHGLIDSVRGVSRWIGSNTTDAEGYSAGFYVTAFNTSGFTVGDGSVFNTNGNTYVAWQWKANGSGSTNTAGSITSTVSANTTSGFSVVTYTATGSVATIGHGLGVAPSLIFLKGRSSALDWFTYHASMGANNGTYLNQTYGAITSANFWNNTAPTSTVFTAGLGVGGSGVTMVAYCFAEVAGYSKFGSYTGNTSTDGPFVYCGFTPKYVLIKKSNVSGTDWRIITINTSYLSANTSAAEYDSPPGPIRGMSNGFKIVGTGGDINNNGDTYIFAAFASYPFKYALAQSA